LSCSDTPKSISGVNTSIADQIRFKCIGTNLSSLPGRPQALDRPTLFLGDLSQEHTVPRRLCLGGSAQEALPRSTPFLGADCSQETLSRNVPASSNYPQPGLTEADSLQEAALWAFRTLKGCTHIRSQQGSFQDLRDRRWWLFRFSWAGRSRRGRKIVITSVGAEDQLIMKHVNQDPMGVRPGLPEDNGVLA
jgi:hypothetical protein